MAETLPPPLPKPPRRPTTVERVIKWLWAQHLFGAVGIVLLASGVIADQVSSRTDFASTELSKDVESRWGAPVAQAAPSVRYVPSGTVFTELKALPLSAQHVNVDAAMNYRKRGLKYFSGFDFTFTGEYAAQNPESHDIDAVFVFPIEVDKSQVLLSDVEFEVNGAPAALGLAAGADRLVWTGRLERGQGAKFVIRYRARGLESFTYHLDPELPARDFKLHVAVQGGDNYDYPAGVLSASHVEAKDGHITLDWAYPSLESGVALGVILPSQKEYDQLAATMARRALLPALAFIGLLSVLALRNKRPLLIFETYLAAAAFGFFFVLLAYLGAFMHFYVAYAVSVLGLGAAVVAYLKRLFPSEKLQLIAGVWASTLIVPTFAVVLEGYTGLVYTLEVLSALLTAMVLITRPAVRAFLTERPA
ncbi:MAG: hypothetical protein JNK82_36510 [Myxococcaceae bacterium]|nr:hypothetical protein [Myxococcaceae bacterium]